MRTRFCATMRRLACSINALIAPVMLRAVASGLMIEKVRSTAIGTVLCWIIQGLAGRGLIPTARAGGKAKWPGRRPPPLLGRLAGEVFSLLKTGFLLFGGLFDRVQWISSLRTALCFE